MKCSWYLTDLTTQMWAQQEIGSSQEQRGGDNLFCGQTLNIAREMRSGISKEEDPHAPALGRNRGGGKEFVSLLIN